MTGAVNLSFGALHGRENRRQAEKQRTAPFSCPPLFPANR